MNKHSRSKSGLFLMELIIVILFFSVSAAICMRIFGAAKIKSDFSRDLSNASVYAQSCAEVYKAYDADLEKTAEAIDGKWDDNTLSVYYDFDWNITQSKDSAKYILVLNRTKDSDIKTTGKIKVNKINGDEVFKLTVKTAQQKTN